MSDESVNNLLSRDGAGFPVAAWLPPLLRATEPVPESFQAECLRAAEVAFTLARMRQASETFPAAPMAVPAFLKGLAAVAKRPLEPVLLWAGLRPDEPAGPAFAAAWVLIARGLRLGLREALVRLRLTFADEVGLELAPALARARGAAGGPADLIEYESYLDREVAHWAPDVLARLGAGEQAVREAYRQADVE
jgi:hypothetical protein